VYELLGTISRRHEVRVYRFANVGNHFHLLIQAKSRAGFNAFLREFAGTVAVMVTGAVKGRPQKFWDALAWSKMVEWGRQFQNTARYILLNVLEGSGFAIASCSRIWNVKASFSLRLSRDPSAT
jgi:REP element-mobilizing transposase RayT